MPNSYPTPDQIMQQTEMLRRMKNAGFAGQPNPIAGGQALPQAGAPPLGGMQGPMPPMPQQPMPQQFGAPPQPQMMNPLGGQLPAQMSPQMQQQMQLRQLAAGAPGTGFKQGTGSSPIPLNAVLGQKSNPFDTNSDTQADQATSIGLRPMYNSKYRSADGSISFPVGQGDMTITGGLGRMFGRGQTGPLDRNISAEYTQNFAKGGKVKGYAEGGQTGISYGNTPVLPTVPVAQPRSNFTGPIYNYIKLMQQKYNPLLDITPVTDTTKNPYVLYPGPTPGPTTGPTPGPVIPTVTTPTTTTPTTTTPLVTTPKVDAAASAAIKNLFQSVLGRDPTTDELSTYLKQYASTGDLLGIKNSISQLPEAQTFAGALKYGMSKDEYAKDLALLQDEYKKLFGRDYNPTTDDYWMKQLASKATDPTKLEANLLSGAQGKDLIYEDYQKLFGHAPDQAGLDYWNKQLASGAVTKDNLLQALASGAQSADYEYLKAHPQAGINLPSAPTLTAADQAANLAKYDAELKKDYQDLFGRAPDTAGEQYWANQLASGAITPDNLINALKSGATGEDLVHLQQAQNPTTTNANNVPTAPTMNDYGILPAPGESTGTSVSTWTPPTGDLSSPAAQAAAIQAARATENTGQGINAQTGANETAAADWLVSQGLLPESTAPTNASQGYMENLAAVRANPEELNALKGAAALGLPGFGVYKKGGSVHMAEGGYMGMPRPQSDVGGMDQINNLMSQQNEVASFARGGKASPLKALAARDYQPESPAIKKIRGEFERRGLDFDGFINNRAVMDQVLTHARMMGEGNDTVLAHITPQEAELLKKKGGSGRINPATGLPMFDEGEGGNDAVGSNSDVSGRGQESGPGIAANDSFGGTLSDTDSNPDTLGGVASLGASPVSVNTDVNLDNPMDASFGFGKTNAITDALSSVMADIAARSSAVNSSPPSQGQNPGRGNTLGGPSLSDIDAANQAAANAAALTEAAQSQATKDAMAAANAALAAGDKSSVSFGKDAKDTSPSGKSTETASNNATSNTSNTSNTSSPATMDSSTTKSADLSNDIATNVNDSTVGTNEMDPAAFGVNNKTSDTTKVAGVTTPGTPATSTPDTEPVWQQSAYDAALQSLIASFGKDKAMELINGNSKSTVKFAKGGGVKTNPLALVKRKTKRA